MITKDNELKELLKMPCETMQDIYYTIALWYNNTKDESIIIRYRKCHSLRNNLNRKVRMWSEMFSIRIEFMPVGYLAVHRL